MERTQHFTSKATGPISAQLIARGLAPSFAQWLIGFGAIYVNHKRAQRDEILAAGDYLRVHLQPKRFPSQAKITTISDHPHFRVIYKPKGLPVHASLDNAHENVIAKLSKHAHEPFYVTHRLDNASEGLLVVAKSTRFQSHFNRNLPSLEKQYSTFTEAMPPLGDYEHYMAPGKRAPRLLHNRPAAGRRLCRLRVLESKPVFSHSPQSGTPDGTRFQNTIQLLTGRTHQIRAQLAHAGHPIVGDQLYGSSFAHSNFRLICHYLKFSFEGAKYEFAIPDKRFK